MRDASEAAIVLAFNVGVMLGIGLVTAQWSLVIGAIILLFAILYYHHNFTTPKDKS